jgi:hypothetical protein
MSNDERRTADDAAPLSTFDVWYTELPDVRLGFEEISEYVKEHARSAQSATLVRAA